MSKKIEIWIVEGAEGPSLQVYGPNNGSGERVLGPKAWGNVYNRPTFTFKNVDAEELCKIIMQYARNVDDPQNGK